jgi:hypothetical protein
MYMFCCSLRSPKHSIIYAGKPPRTWHPSKKKGSRTKPEGFLQCEKKPTILKNIIVSTTSKDIIPLPGHQESNFVYIYIYYSFKTEEYVAINYMSVLIYIYSIHIFVLGHQLSLDLAGWHNLFDQCGSFQPLSLRTGRPVVGSTWERAMVSAVTLPRSYFD